MDARSIRGRVVLASLALCLALACGAGPGAQAERGDVLIAFDFENGMENTGLWGGEAIAVEHARGEGPKVTPGVGLGGGGGLDFASASRSGGLESNLAGGILSYEHPGREYPENFTIALWFYLPDPRGYERLFDPVTITDPVSQKRPRLDLYVQQYEALVLETRFIHGEERPRGRTPILPGRWYFAAVSVDREQSKIAYYLGGPGEGQFGLEIEFGYDEVLTMGYEFRLGNADMIRPFKGYMDRVRVIEGNLSPEEIEALWREGLAHVREPFSPKPAGEQPVALSSAPVGAAPGPGGETAGGQELAFWFMEPHDLVDAYGLLEFRSSPLRFVAHASGGGGVPISVRAVVPREGVGLWPGDESGWWLYSSSQRGEGERAVWTIDRYFTTDGVRLVGPQELYSEPATRWLGTYGIARSESTGEMLFLRSHRGDNIGLTVYAYGSRDGVEWRRLSGLPVYRDHDAFTLFWDPRSERYIVYQTTYQNWPKPIPDNIGDATRRVIHIRTSRDGVQWDPSFDVSFWNRPSSRAPEERLIVPNEWDPPGMEFYLMSVFPYAGRYVAMVLNYEPSPAVVNPVDYIPGHGPYLSAEWWTSDDGIHWRRPYQGQDAVGDAPGIVTHAPMVVGDELRFLISRNTYAVGVDRIAGVYSKGNGAFSTPLFEMVDSPLYLNVAAAHRSIPAHASVWGLDRQSYVMVELLDQDSNVIPGYEREKGVYVNVDDTALKLTWDGKDGTEFAGEMVQVRFYFRDATIYALRTKDE